jgi:hypothetical protein
MAQEVEVETLGIVGAIGVAWGGRVEEGITVGRDNPCRGR